MNKKLAQQMQLTCDVVMESDIVSVLLHHGNYLPVIPKHHNNKEQT